MLGVIRAIVIFSILLAIVRSQRFRRRLFSYPVNLNTRIVGGRPAAFNEFPYQVAIKSKTNALAFCGGAIIDNYWVLTAAHCMKGENKDSFVVVSTANNLLQGNRVLHPIDKIIQHHGYGLFSKANDIALLKTTTPLISHGARAITLPKKGQDFTGKPAIVSGFGTVSEFGDKSPILLTTTMKILPDFVCQRTYWFSYKRGPMICGGGNPGKDACFGDSGGPFAVPVGGGKVLAGIISYGHGCARPNTPGVYTNVSHYVDWILEKIRTN